MLKFSSTLCSFIPPALAAWLGWLLHSRGASDTSHACALALATSAALATAYAIRTLWQLTADARRATAGWAEQLAILLLPLAVTEVTLWTFALTWGLVEATVLIRRAWIANHIDTAITLRAALSLCSSALVLYLLRLRTKPSTPERIRRLTASRSPQRKLHAMYLRATARGDRATVRALAKAPKMPPELLRQFATDPDLEIRACVANNPNTPPDLLDRFSHEASLEIRRAVAHNPAVTLAQLQHLADAPEQDLAQHARALLAGKLAAPTPSPSPSST
jgi:hypothetical protein